MTRKGRAVILMMDSFGIGAAEDAAFVNGVLASVIRDKEGDNAHEQP